MVNQKRCIYGVGNQRLLRNLSHLGKLTRELQELSMAMRMVPIQGVFQKNEHDWCAILLKRPAKTWSLYYWGETELDRKPSLRRSAIHWFTWSEFRRPRHRDD